MKKIATKWNLEFPKDIVENRIGGKNNAKRR